MKKLLKFPFLCLLVLSVVAAMPFVWQEIGLLPELPQQEANVSLPAPDPDPELRDPEPAPALDPEPVPQPDPIPQPDPVPDPVPVPEPVPEPAPDPDPLPEPPELHGPVKPENPFENALFIGDSRTVGLYEYAGITDADFYANTGMSVFTMFKDESEGNVRDMLLEQLLTEKQYDRIYLMLGINELGYPLQMVVDKYAQIVARVRELQPEAYLHLQANMHVTAARSAGDKLYNNENLNRLNQEAVAPLADNEQIFYLDVNILFDDEQGGLIDEYTGDGVHLYARHYGLWADWLWENTPA